MQTVVTVRQPLGEGRVRTATHNKSYNHDLNVLFYFEDSPNPYPGQVLRDEFFRSTYHCQIICIKLNLNVNNTLQKNSENEK